jgi:hypothetical protein
MRESTPAPPSPTPPPAVRERLPRLSSARLAAVVEAAYILQAASR